MKPRRSWTAKTKLEMIVLNLNQQFQALRKYYPNYMLSAEMLKKTIDSLNYMGRPPGIFG